MNKCSMRPDAMGGCPTGYRLFKMKGIPCCRRVSRQAPCPKTKKDRKVSRRFISPVSGRCVTRAGQIRAQSRLDKMNRNEIVSMSGDEPLGDYASEAGITFFGRIRRAKKLIKRYNVSGSPCNRIKKKTCKAKHGCNYVKRRGCRRAKGFAKNIIAGAVPIVNKQVAEAGMAAAAAAVETGAPVAEQAIAAAAAAGDAAAANVEAAGGTPKQAHEAAVAAAAPAAQQVIEAAGIPPNQAEAIINNAVETIIAVSSGTESMAGQVAAMARARAERLGRTVGFGRRRSRFGSPCSTLLPKDTNTCMNYNIDGMYPCAWSGGANSRCQARANGPVPYNTASTVGKYISYVMAVTPGLVSMAPPPPVIPISSMNLRGKYVCTGKNMSECGSNPNCKWQAGAKPPRCVRRAGHNKGQQYEGPMGPSPADEELASLMFGRRHFGGFAASLMKKASSAAKGVADKTKAKAIEAAKKAKIEAAKQLEIAKALAKKQLELAKEAAKELAKEQLELAKAAAKEQLELVKEEAKAAVKERVDLAKATVSKHLEPTTEFGKKRRTRQFKPSAALIKRCRKHHIKITIKKGGKRVYKSTADLKKLISSFGDSCSVRIIKGKPHKSCLISRLGRKSICTFDGKKVPCFGKKRRKVRKTPKGSKLSSKIRKLCKKFKIKTTKKVGGKKVCKKLSVIKKLIARKMKKIIKKIHKKMKKIHKAKHHSRR